jgi:TRAP-type mannitol/chloroaromatic compound transport system permease large subunit
MGFLASYSGIGANLFTAADKFIGHLRGGIASATQVACGVFGAICGSIPATIATMSTVAYPEMCRREYNKRLSTSSIAAGASLSVLIPPTRPHHLRTHRGSIGRFHPRINPIILMILYISRYYTVPAQTKPPAPRPLAALATLNPRRSLNHNLFSCPSGFHRWFTHRAASCAWAFRNIAFKQDQLERA